MRSWRVHVIVRWCCGFWMGLSVGAHANQLSHRALGDELSVSCAILNLCLACRLTDSLFGFFSPLSRVPAIGRLSFSLVDFQPVVDLLPVYISFQTVCEPATRYHAKAHYYTQSERAERASRQGERERDR